MFFLLVLITQFFIYCNNIIRYDITYPTLGRGGPVA